jgi:hypothetical protein
MWTLSRAWTSSVEGLSLQPPETKLESRSKLRENNIVCRRNGKWICLPFWPKLGRRKFSVCLYLLTAVLQPIEKIRQTPGNHIGRIAFLLGGKCFLAQDSSGWPIFTASMVFPVGTLIPTHPLQDNPNESTLCLGKLCKDSRGSEEAGSRARLRSWTVRLQPFLAEEQEPFIKGSGAATRINFLCQQSGYLFQRKSKWKIGRCSAPCLKDVCL